MLHVNDVLSTTLLCGKSGKGLRVNVLQINI